MRVEVQIVTGSRDRALRMERGSLLWRNGGQELFVLRGDRAVRTPVTIGMTGTSHFEILRGVQPGDTVVLSPMEDYLSMSKVKVR